MEELPQITSSLTSGTDVTIAKEICSNSSPKCCFVGQAPQSDGFYLTPQQANLLLNANDMNHDVVFPFLIGRDMLSKHAGPTRFVIDFGQRDINAAKKYSEPFSIVKTTVLPDVEAKAINEKLKSGRIGDWNWHMQKWWLHWRARPELFQALSGKQRYIAVSRVTKRPIFEFVSTTIHPGDALVAFTLEDDYSFGILQSSIHWEWFKARCSTLKGDWRYTGDTVFDSFPWPQKPTIAQIQAVARAALELRQYRRKLMGDNKWGLKQVYETLELPGENPLKKLNAKLDAAVKVVYDMNADQDILTFLLDLNHRVAKLEREGKPVIGPGLPLIIKNVEDFVSTDCIVPNI